MTLKLMYDWAKLNVYSSSVVDEPVQPSYVLPSQVAKYAVLKGWKKAGIIYLPNENAVFIPDDYSYEL